MIVQVRPIFHSCTVRRKFPILNITSSSEILTLVISSDSISRCEKETHRSDRNTARSVAASAGIRGFSGGRLITQSRLRCPRIMWRRHGGFMAAGPATRLWQDLEDPWRINYGVTRVGRSFSLSFSENKSDVYGVVYDPSRADPLPRVVMQVASPSRSDAHVLEDDALFGFTSVRRIIRAFCAERSVHSHGKYTDRRGVSRYLEEEREAMPIL